jgi:hypothetical protein
MLTDIPHMIDFSEGDTCLSATEAIEDEESQLAKPEHELLLYHYKFAHEPFKNL